MNEFDGFNSIPLPGPGVVDQTSHAYNNLLGVAPNPGVNILAEQSTASGTTVDFTIPAGAERVTVMWVGGSTNGTTAIIVQLGDAGGIETTGYTGAAVTQAGTVNAYPAGFTLINIAVAAAVYQAVLTLSLQNAATFTWMGESSLTNSSTIFTRGVGSKALSAELTTVRLTSVGPDTFDAGAVSVSWE